MSTSRPITSLGDLLEAPEKTRKVAATVAGDQIVTKEEMGEIYIRADGKKVRRVKKTVLKKKTKPPSDNNNDDGGAAVVSESIVTKSAMTTAPEDDDDNASLVSYMSQGVRKKKKKNKKSAISSTLQNINSVENDDDDTGSVVSYMSASGTKRKKKKNSKKKALEAAAIASQNDATITTSDDYDNGDDGSVVSFVSAGGTKRKKKKKKKVLELQASAIAAQAEGTVPQTEGEIYINKDGKKVRRVRKTKSNDNLGATTSLSGLGINTSGVKTGSATVAGDRVAEKSEIYINADGKKVRRVKKTVVRSASSAPTPSSIAGNKTELSKMLDSGSAAKTTGAATISGGKPANLEGEIYINKDGKKVRRVKKAVAKSPTDASNSGVSAAGTSLGSVLDKSQASNAIGSATVTGSSNLEGEIYIRADGKKVRRVKKLAPTSAPPGGTAVPGEAEGEIYINKDGKKVRRVRRNPSVVASSTGTSSTASSNIQQSFPSATSAAKEGAKASTAQDLVDGVASTKQGGKASTVAAQSEIYINKDGKKVRRVRRTASSDQNMDLGKMLDVGKPVGSGAKTVGGGRLSSEEGEIYINAQGKKVRRVMKTRPTATGTTINSLEGLLDREPKLIGSATVAGEKKIDNGEIVIRADGKKVIRRMKPKDQETEVYRRADGKLVRRVKKQVEVDSRDQKENKQGEKIQSLASPTIQLTDEEEKIASEYRKMKKMGLPDNAVRHKMTVSNVAAKIIAAVLGDKWPPPDPAPLSSSSHHHLNTSIPLTGGEEALAIQYRKMKSLGLPDDAVRHKMVVNNVDPKIIAAVFGDKWPPPAKQQQQQPQPQMDDKFMASVKENWQRKQEPSMKSFPEHEEDTGRSSLIPITLAPAQDPVVTDPLKTNNDSLRLTEEEEDLANYYRKMKQMGISDNAIRTKMGLNEVDPKIILVVLGDDVHSAVDETAITISTPLLHDTSLLQEKGELSRQSLPVVVLTQEEEDMANYYIKMKKMGLADEAIHQKMVLNEVDPKIILAVFGGESTIPVSSVTSPTPVLVSDAPDDAQEEVPSSSRSVATAVAGTLTEEEENIAAYYLKMKRMGLNDDAVRHKMVINEIDPKIISAVLADEPPVSVSVPDTPTILTPSETQQIVASGEARQEISSATSSFVPLTEEEESVAAYYRKMKRMGLDDAAVRHKMVLSEVDPKIMFAVLGEETHAATATSDVPVSDTKKEIVIPSKEIASSLTADEEDVAAHYRKMKKMGLSDDAVHHKMVLEEVDPKIILAVLGEEQSSVNVALFSETIQKSTNADSVSHVVPKPSIILTAEEEENAAPYRKMQKMGLPNDVVRHKMTSMDVSSKIIAAVLGEEWSETSAPQDASILLDVIPDPVVNRQHVNLASVIELNVEEEEVASQYRKMQKMGIPDEVVRHKMASMDVHPKIIAAVLGEAWNDRSANSRSEMSQTVTPGVQTIQLSVEEEEIAAQYKKMQKMGLPDDVVRHKMTSMDVHPKVVASVLGDAWSDPSASGVNSDVPHLTVVSNAAIQLSAEEEEISVQYQKMQRMGLPNDVVRHKMTSMDVHPKIIAAVLGEVWNDPSAKAESAYPQVAIPDAQTINLSAEEEEIAAQYKKMQRMGLPNDVVRHKMTSMDVHPKIIAAVLDEAWNDPPEKTESATRGAPTIQLSVEEEEIAAQYLKMQRMGLPNDVVRHKMTSMDVHPKVVAAVLGEEWNDPAAIAKSALPQSVAHVTQPIQLSVEEEEIAAQYKKMQKMGLPDDAVRHKMTSMDVPPKIVASVFGEAWNDPSAKAESVLPQSVAPVALTIQLSEEEEEIAAQYKKMQKMGLPNDVVRHKMISMDVHPKIVAVVLGEVWKDPFAKAESALPQSVAPVVATFQLSAEEEEIAAQYKKMQKMGLPNDVVRHKMTSMDVHPKIVAVVLGEVWHDPSAKAESALPQSVAPVAATIQLSAEEEDIAAQYKKMQKMGLPNDVVRHKMTSMDVHPKIMAFVLGEEWKDSIPQQGAALLDAQLPASEGYLVFEGDGTLAQQQFQATSAAGTSGSDFQLSPDEKFAVRVAEGAHSGSGGGPKTKFITLAELAKMSGQSQTELESIVKEKKRRGASPPRFVLQSLAEQRFEVEIPESTVGGSGSGVPSSGGPDLSHVNPKNVKEVKDGEEVVDSALANAARAVSALGQSDMNALLEKLKAGDMAELLERLKEAEKRQKKLEKQLQQAGVAIAEDIDYAEAKLKVEQIAKRMNEIGGSDVVVADKEEQNKLREEYFKLEQEMERYNTALTLSEEYQAEQDRLAKKWEDDNEADNLEALKCIRRHMPVMIRHMSEADLANKPSPNGKYLPKSIAKKFKRTNILQCLRLNPADLERMHPSTLENMRVTGLTLTERRAVYLHLKTLGPKWERNKAEKMTERKWTWYQMMKNNFKESLAPYLRHCAQYGPSSNHPYATRDNPNVGCPLLGKQCPVRADKEFDYSGDYGYPEGDEYEISNVKKSDVDDPGAKAKAEAAELAREKKANERADILKKHYKGKLLQVSKANGSCESMDEAMDRMENHTMKWIEFIIEKGSKDELEADKKMEIGSFTEALNELKLSTIDYATRSGMQMSGKKKAGGDSPDIRSSVEASLSEETFECTREFFSFIKDRMKEISMIDTRVEKAIDLLDALWTELHEKNLALLDALGVKRSQRSRKLKKNADLRKEVEDKQKKPEEGAKAEEATPGSPRPPMGGGGRGGLLDAISGRGRGRGGDAGGRGGLLDAISGRGKKGRGGDAGGRGGLLDAIAGRGKGRGGDTGGRGGLLDAIKSGGGGRGGRGGEAGGRGGLLAAIAARGGGS